MRPALHAENVSRIGQLDELVADLGATNDYAPTVDPRSNARRFVDRATGDVLTPDEMVARLRRETRDAGRQLARHQAPQGHEQQGDQVGGAGEGHAPTPTAPIQNGRCGA